MRRAVGVNQHKLVQQALICLQGKVAVTAVDQALIQCLGIKVEKVKLRVSRKSSTHKTCVKQLGNIHLGHYFANNRF